MIDKKIEDILTRKLPDEAVKKHPSKTYLSVIHPMYVIDVLNEAFGIGRWQYKTEPVNFVGKFAVVKGTLIVPEHGIHIEQFGGNDNADVGDAYKGASTDALTKIASYLGVGAMIYKGQGNTDIPKEWTLDEALTHVSQSTDEADLTKRFKELSVTMQKDGEVIARCKELKTNFTNNVS